jgi:acyl-CoA thioesterase-1
MLTVSMPTNYGPQYASAYRKVYDDLRVRYKVSSAALMSPAMAVDLTYFQADGIHPSAEAQPLLLNNVWTALEPLLRR